MYKQIKSKLKAIILGINRISDDAEFEMIRENMEFILKNWEELSKQEQNKLLRLIDENNTPASLDEAWQRLVELTEK